jgi:Protein of unknown function (DUF669)
MSGPLNLQDADLSGFDAVEPGKYNATVFEVKWDAVKNPGGKVPIGTPMLKIQFRASEDNPEGLENRRFFTQFVVPPKDYDKAKAQKMKGMIARALIALGEAEEAVLSKGYDLDTEDLVGRECVIVVGREPKKTTGGEVVEGEFNNPVKGIKPAGTDTGSTSGGLL